MLLGARLSSGHPSYVARTRSPHLCRGPAHVPLFQCSHKFGKSEGFLQLLYLLSPGSRCAKAAKRMAPCRLSLEGLVRGPVRRSTVGVVACRLVPPVRAQNVLTTCELQYGAKTRRNAFPSSLSQIGACGAKCRHSVDRFAQGVHGGEEDSDNPESSGTFWKASQNARF